MTRQLSFTLGFQHGQSFCTSTCTYLSPFMYNSRHSRTWIFRRLEDELLLVLMKLRLNLMLEDLACRYGTTIGSVSRIIQKWLDVMFVRMRFLVSWPTREISQHNMPDIFKKLYPSCICRIDCSEIFVETQTNFNATAKTYSNYKKHNTIKFLIGITPNGSISFLSRCWGGCVRTRC